MIYETANSVLKLDELFAGFAGIGLTIKHPAKGVAIAVDREGEQFPITETELQERINCGAVTCFQAWRYADESVFCEISIRKRVRFIGFGLRGVDEAFRQTLREALLRFFLSRAQHGIGFGFVFDPAGITSDYNWDTFFVCGRKLRRDDLRSGLPELLIVLASLATKTEGFSLRKFDQGTIAVHER